MKKYIIISVLLVFAISLTGCIKTGTKEPLSKLKVNINEGDERDIVDEILDPEYRPSYGVNIVLSFAHVKPGEYSEVYSAITTVPGSEVTSELVGPGVASLAKQTIQADENGVAHFVWKIDQVGQYKTFTRTDEKDTLYVEDITVK